MRPASPQIYKRIHSLAMDEVVKEIFERKKVVVIIFLCPQKKYRYEVQ